MAFRTIREKWGVFYEKTKPFWNVMKKIGHVFKIIGRYIYTLRGVILSIPVAAAAIYLAILNAARLPETVGVNLLSTGEFGLLMPKLVVVFLPLLLTAICIAMTLLSKRILFPWLISVFTLVLPILIWIINIYPA